MIIRKIIFCLFKKKNCLIKKTKTRNSFYLFDLKIFWNILNENCERIHMNKNFLISMLLILLIITTAFSEQDEMTVLLVNGEKITSAEINYELRQLENQAMIRGEQQQTPLNYSRMSELRKNVIDLLINKKLLLQECNRRNVIIEPEDIERHLSALKNQFLLEQQFNDFLIDSCVTLEKLKEEIEISLKIDFLANQEIRKQDKDKIDFSEIEKQRALGSLLVELHRRAEIIR